MTRLLLVRHGESEWNADGRWQGWADPPLSDLGRRQALVAADAVGAVDAVVSSDLRRASETAAIIAEALGIGPVLVEPALRERDVGDWTGLRTAEIESRWPGGVEAVRRGDVPGAPNGEDDQAVLDRVLPALHRLAAAHEGAALLAVTHGGVVRLLERHLGTTPAALPNLGGVLVDVVGERLSVGERILLVDPDDAAVTIPRQL